MLTLDADGHGTSTGDAAWAQNLLAQLRVKVVDGIPKDAVDDGRPYTTRLLRIAQRGWNGSQPARTLDEVGIGLQCLWIELGGVRCENVAEVEFAARNAFTTPRVTLEWIGPVEIVYVGADGQILGSQFADPADIGTLNADAETPRPAQPDLVQVMTERDTWRARALKAEQDLRACWDQHGIGLEPAPDRIHACPPGDETLTPCCHRSPFELPRDDRMTSDPALVNCSGPQ